MKYPPPWLRMLLLPLSYLYAWVNRVRRNWYERGFLSSFSLPGIVISIGNIEAGGTGKSPMTLELCAALRAQGATPVVLTRGYKSGLSPKESAVLLGEKTALAPQNSLSFAADEARMQAARLGSVPIVIGVDRYAAAKRYLEHFPAPSHWVLDDGFQHLRIRRQMDIVLLDAERPFDNGRCLPAGLLRERPETLKHASWIIFTRADACHPNQQSRDFLQKLGRPSAAVAFKSGEPLPIHSGQAPWASIGSWCLALGVAKPDRVEKALASFQLPIAARITVADHEHFDKDTLQHYLSHAEALLTTEKDYWREKHLFDTLGKPVYLIPLTVSWQKDVSFSTIIQSLTESL